MTLLTSARETVIARLCEDLAGPRRSDEVLASRPSDVYLTGILWPRKTDIAPEEDERLSVAPGGEDSGDDAEDQAQAQSVAMRRPSTAGISFAARAEKGPASVRVHVRFGMYHHVESEKDTRWQRTPHEPDALLIELKPGSEDYPFVSGIVTGLRLNVRSVPFSNGMLATITLVNDLVPEAKDRNAIEHVTLFQVELEIGAAEGTKLIARPSRRAPVDAEDWSAALLYRRAHEFAAGHTCAADWITDDKDTSVARKVFAAWLPQATVQAVSPDGDDAFRNLANDGDDPLSAAWLASAADGALEGGLLKLCDAYGRWIDREEKRIGELDEKFASVARLHIEEARRVKSRMAGGVSFLKSSEAARTAFRLANLAMDAQRQWVAKSNLRWRPFQLGFMLLALQSTADGKHPDRDVMDLLWFPTGGGKTEAYLGLIAFVSFYRRLSAARPDDGAGVAVIMRYTLRLLTTQQFIRASAMIFACEAIRRGKIGSAGSRLGTRPFGIGLWVGSDATPNNRQAAFDSLSDSTKSTPHQLTKCPCCSERLNYRQSRPTDSVEARCDNSQCVLSGEVLPVWAVDEDVYAFRPTLLIGTVDKFAQIVRRPETGSLFSVGGPMQPQLILQDELHLISGPLGTLAGLYETALDLILSAQGVRPKIIGSTATIRRAPDQVLALFDRKTCQFPPAGIDAENSGFTVVDPALPGRRYVGVTTAGRSAKFTLQAVTASLLQTASGGLSSDERDPYWTLIAYFNSLRELGGAVVLMQDDVNDTIRLLAAAHGENARALRSVQELTSRRSQEEIKAMLETLEHPAGHDAALDVVLATNMVSVGVDIPRLGLMTVNGQPKTMAEYIQSTSRVGRGSVPGLVIPILNNAKPRDRSHFETFRTWHTTLYREVEATSVTPFASRARDRALHAVLVAIVRHLVPGRLGSPALDDDSIRIAEELIVQVAQRAQRIDPLETDVENELRERLARWRRRAPQQYWSRYPKTSLLQSAEYAAALRAAGRVVGQAWPTPNTMRGVEPSTNYRLTERLKGRS